MDWNEFLREAVAEKDADLVRQARRRPAHFRAAGTSGGAVRKPVGANLVFALLFFVRARKCNLWYNESSRFLTLLFLTPKKVLLMFTPSKLRNSLGSRRSPKSRWSLLGGAACALLAAALAAPAFADQPIYTDSLQNGWANWSWAATNTSSASPTHTGGDAISVQAGGYQALYLHHDAQAASGFTALRFWINGGPTGGQKLQVQATLGGAAQAASALPALAANTWTQVTIPLSQLGITNQTSFDGFWIQDISGQSSVPAFFVDDAALLTSPPAPVAATIKIDAAAGMRPINPLVYGVAYGDAQSLALLNAPLNRMGGNNTTRYNWQLNADNKASDYFFESIGDPSAVPGERADTFVSASKAGGAQAMLTVPMLGWVAKLGPNRQKLPGFSVAKYGPQQSVDPYLPDAGSGVRADGTPITGNDPNDADTPATPAFQAGWLSHLVSKWGHGAKGGVRYFLMDNEPSLWHLTHRTFTRSRKRWMS